MPLPDPYADEPTTELDAEIYKLWQQARSNADGWVKEADRLRARLIIEVGDNTAGTINGVKVIYYRPSDSYATARLVKENPELTQHYMITPDPSEVFDLDHFKQVHPDIAERYRVRTFRNAG